MTAAKPRIGVLALQGDFEAHRRVLDRAGVESVEVRCAEDLKDIKGLIIPGGESTTMLKLIEEEGLFDELRRFAADRPVFGTCAGAILLASEVTHPEQRSLGLIDMTVERNAYGRQIDSFVAPIDLEGEKVEAVFIRAPLISRVGRQAKVLGTYESAPVLVEQGKLMAATFHPELTADSRIHQRFIQKVLSEPK